MAVTKDDVLASLARVSCPDGTPLHKSGALSDVLATDGKVFFSITVDAAQVKAWESVRKQAEEVVRAMPGVTSAMVALTAERKGGDCERARVERALHGAKLAKRHEFIDHHARPEKVANFRGVMPRHADEPGNGGEDPAEDGL